MQELPSSPLCPTPACIKLAFSQLCQDGWATERSVSSLYPVAGVLKAQQGPSAVGQVLEKQRDALNPGVTSWETQYFTCRDLHPRPTRTSWARPIMGSATSACDITQTQLWTCLGRQEQSRPLQPYLGRSAHLPPTPSVPSNKFKSQLLKAWPPSFLGTAEWVPNKNIRVLNVIFSYSPFRATPV